MKQTYDEDAYQRAGIEISKVTESDTQVRFILMNPKIRFMVFDRPAA